MPQEELKSKLEPMAKEIETRLGLVLPEGYVNVGEFNSGQFFLKMSGEIQESQGKVVDESGDLSILYATRAEQLKPQERRALEMNLLWQINEMGRSNDPSIKKLYALVAGINRQFTEE